LIITEGGKIEEKLDLLGWESLVGHAMTSNLVAREMLSLVA